MHDIMSPRISLGLQQVYLKGTTEIQLGKMQLRAEENAQTFAQRIDKSTQAPIYIMFCVDEWQDHSEYFKILSCDIEKYHVL